MKGLVTEQVPNLFARMATRSSRPANVHKASMRTVPGIRMQRHIAWYSHESPPLHHSHCGQLLPPDGKIEKQELSFSEWMVNFPQSLLFPLLPQSSSTEHTTLLGGKPKKSRHRNPGSPCRVHSLTKTGRARQVGSPGKNTCHQA